MSNSEENNGRPAGEKVRLKPNKFSVTCSLLSRYLNDQKRDFGPGLSFHPTDNNNNNNNNNNNHQPKTPRTMDLLPAPSPPAVHFKPDPPPISAQKKPQPDASQLTIFYAGKVLVFDDFPVGKAKELVAMAAKGGGAATAASRRDPVIVTVPDRPTCPPPQTTMPPPSSTSTSSSGSGGKCPPTQVTQTANLLSASDLPIARRVSLNRFLEKRKGRISSKAPYPLERSPDLASTSTNTTTSGGPAMVVDGSSSAFPGFGKPELPAKAQQIVDPTAFGKHDTVDPVPVSAAAAAAPEEKQQTWLRLATPSSSGQSEFDLKR